MNDGYDVTITLDRRCSFRTRLIPPVPFDGVTDIPSDAA